MADTSSQVDEIQLESLQEENDLADRANPLVAKAVAFLNHPSVRAHKTEDKKTFLKKKGLAENEIGAALRLADSSESIADSFVNEFGSSAPLLPPEWSGSLQVKNQLQQYQNVGTFCLVFGGLAYAGYKIFKEFIEPYMFPERRRTFELTMASFLEKTNQSMQQLHTTLERIQLSLESQQHSPVQSSVRELKAELASVKSLLLNRAQFPPAPLASGIAPSIPSWQLKSSGTGGGPAGDAGRYGSYSGREEGGRKSTRTGASGSSRRNVSGSDNTGNSSEESLEIIPSAGNRTHAPADYAASSPSPPAEDPVEKKVAGGDGDL